MDFLPKETYKKILVSVLYIVLAAVIGFVFFKYLISLLLPFIIAFCVAMVIRPLAQTLNKRTGIPVKVLSAFLVIIILLVLGAFAFFILDKLIYEFGGIVDYINENADRWIDDALRTVNKVLDRVPFLQTFGSEREFVDSLEGMAGDMLKGVTSKAPEMLTRAVTLLPNLLFVSLILIMASYYFSADYEDIINYALSFFPERLKGKTKSVVQKLKIAGIKVLKGYIMTVGITFLQLYAGFLILKTDYAFTLALVIAVLDVLPVIGVGTILIPWAAVKLLAGGYYQGFGLLIIFGVVSVVREILEPKIIGKSIGLHPLATLFSMYIGLELCGFVGMISFPVAVIAMKTALEENRSK